MLNKITQFFNFTAYFLLTYFLLKIYKTDYLETLQTRTKIKSLLIKRQDLQKSLALLKQERRRGKQTQITRDLAKLKKEIKQLAPKDKLKHFDDLLSQL